MTEALFLSRRQARFAERVRLKEQHGMSSYTEEKEEFEDAQAKRTEWLAGELDGWKEMLQEELEGSSKCTISSEEEKRRIRMRLVELQGYLHELRTQVLAQIAMSRTRDSEFAIIHGQFITCQALLDSAKHTLLPKGKFVFGRYRLALANLDQRTKEEMYDRVEETSKTESLPVESSNTDILLTEDVARIENFEDVLIQVTNEDVRIYQRDSIKSNTLPLNANIIGKEAMLVEERRNRSTGPPSFLSQLKRCQIDFHHFSMGSSTFSLSNLFVVDSQDLHIRLLCDDPSCVVHSTASTIQSSTCIGAIHVTDCIRVSVEGHGFPPVQQLRLHSSAFLSFGGIHITAGAILEGCHNVTFYQNSSDENNNTSKELQIRDFDWLKPGVPSPNFSVFESSTCSMPSSFDTSKWLHTPKSPALPSPTAGLEIITEKSKNASKECVPLNSRVDIAADEQEEEDSDEEL